MKVTFLNIFSYLLSFTSRQGRDFHDRGFLEGSYWNSVICCLLMLLFFFFNFFKRFVHVGLLISPDYLSLVPGAHMVEGDKLQFYPITHMHASTHKRMHAQCCVCLFLRVYAPVYVRTHTDICLCLWRPEVDFGYRVSIHSPPLFSNEHRSPPFSYTC